MYMAEKNGDSPTRAKPGDSPWESHEALRRDSPRFCGTVPVFSPPAQELVELEVKYEGYIERMKRQLGQFEELESIRIPERLDFNRVPGLSNEVRERLARNRPASVGMAQRMPGVTPAAVFALMAYLRNK